MGSISKKKNHMLQVFLRGEYSDMKINCGGHTFNVHRAILCPQSHFFNSAMSSGFKESLSHSIDLPDDDPACIERVLAFLYLQDYEQAGHTLSLETLSTVKQPESPVEKQGGRKRKFSTVQDEPATDTVSTEHTSPNTPVPEDSSPEPVTPKDNSSEAEIIFNNIDVYLAADKFGITDLSGLAGLRICTWLSENIRSEVFLGAAQKIMESGHISGPTLINHLSEVISKNISDFMSQERFLPLLHKFGCLGSAILVKYVTDQNAHKSTTQKYERALQKLRNTSSCRSCRSKTYPSSEYIFRGAFIEDKYFVLSGDLQVCCSICKKVL